MTFFEGIDLVKARYGYTDDQVFAIPYARLADELENIIAAMRRDEERQWEKVARLCFSWEGQEGESFNDFLTRRGFKREPAPPKADIEAEKERALRTAEEIVKMVQG